MGGSADAIASGWTSGQWCGGACGRDNCDHPEPQGIRFRWTPRVSPPTLKSVVRERDHEGETLALVERLRVHAGRAVETSTLGGVAREIGVGSRTLARFVYGGACAPTTVEKVFVHTVSRAVAEEPDAVTALHLVREMIRHINPSLRPLAVVELVRGIKMLHRQRGIAAAHIEVLADFFDQLSPPLARLRTSTASRTSRGRRQLLQQSVSRLYSPRS